MCIFQSYPTSDSNFIRPLIPKQSTTDSSGNPSTLYDSIGMSGRSKSEYMDGISRNVKLLKMDKRVESIVNSGYPFLYIIRKGGRNGQREETFHA